ncbi:PaaI family thioesterase [Piscinibacter sakaiensis]|uniref:Thioesterase domain-containing protein n=1 Tax=Piscinibacter sakaiensis TaxID=1547922 RepID=A0A0K8P2H4_PISS1|nr:PaaI family thioesterase [Piscinibacter sakaiensis]GAP36734.1 hypothetical protein ISF6_2574 [Piscinibacter sakaiensis]
MSATPPTADRLAAELPGLAIVQRMLDGEVPGAPIAEALDYRLVEAALGVASFEGQASARFLNPHGTVHGGWIATVLDSALGCAVRTTLKPGHQYTTLDLKVSFLRALTPRTGPVRATGRVLHSGGRVASAEARLTGPDGSLYAHATATCLVLPASPPRSEPPPAPQGTP